MATAPPAPDDLYHQNTLSRPLRDFCCLRFGPRISYCRVPYTFSWEVNSEKYQLAHIIAPSALFYARSCLHLRIFVSWGRHARWVLVSAQEPPPTSTFAFAVLSILQPRTASGCSLACVLPEPTRLSGPACAHHARLNVVSSSRVQPAHIQSSDLCLQQNTMMCHVAPADLSNLTSTMPSMHRRP